MGPRKKTQILAKNSEVSEAVDLHIMALSGQFWPVAMLL